MRRSSRSVLPAVTVVLTFVVCAVAWPTADAPASMGDYKAELVTRLAGMLKLAPIRSAAEEAGCQIVASGPDELVIKYAGKSNNVVSIRSSGEIVVRSTRQVTSLEDVDRLNADLATAFGYIESVSEAIPDKAKFGCLHLVRYRLSDPGVLKRIVFPPGTYEGKINVPQCKVKQARFVVLPAPNKNAEIHLRDQRIYRTPVYGPYKGNSQALDVTSQIVFGAHQVEVDVSERYPSMVVMEAITSSTSDLVYYSGGGIERVLTTLVGPISATTSDGTQSQSSVPGAAQPGVGGTYVIPVDSRKMQDLVDQIASQATAKGSVSKPATVAILDFDLIPERSGTRIDDVVARNVREDLTTGMSAVRCFRVLERSQLARALENLKLDQSGVIDQETAKRIGKMVSADFALVGSVSDRGSTVVVQGRMIDAETGETSYTGRVDMPKTAPKALPNTSSAELTSPGLSLADIERAVSANPSAPDPYADLALYWHANNDPGRCASALSKALHLDPDRFAAGSCLYDKLARIVAERGDMLAPTVRLVQISEGRTVGVADRSTLSAKDDSVGIECVDDSGLASVELYVGDSPFAKTTWSFQGQHAGLVKLRSPWVNASGIGPRTPIEI